MNLQEPHEPSWYELYMRDQMKAENDDWDKLMEGEMYGKEFEGMKKDDVIWSQHQIILQQKKEIAELNKQLYGHLPSSNVNNY